MSTQTGCLITGTYTDAAGAALTGRVYFTPVPRAVAGQADSIMVRNKPVEAVLVGGSFSVVLIGTDDMEFSPTGYTYQVREQVPGGLTYYINAPVGTDLDLSTVQHVTESGGTE